MLFLNRLSKVKDDRFIFSVLYLLKGMVIKMKNLNKYFYSMKLGIQNSMEYRVDFFLDIINGFFPIFVQFFVWSAIFKNSSSSVIQGYTFSGMMVYLVYASVISKFIAAGFEYE